MFFSFSICETYMVGIFVARVSWGSRTISAIEEVFWCTTAGTKQVFSFSILKTKFNAFCKKRIAELIISLIRSQSWLVVLSSSSLLNFENRSRFVDIFNFWFLQTCSMSVNLNLIVGLIWRYEQICNCIAMLSILKLIRSVVRIVNLVDFSGYFSTFHRIAQIPALTVNKISFLWNFDILLVA